MPRPTRLSGPATGFAPVTIEFCKHLILVRSIARPRLKSAVVKTYPVPSRRFASTKFVWSCFCGRPHGRKTARRTTIGASSRTSVLQVAASCSVTFCIWARSIPRRPRCGARPSRCSTRTRGIRGRWRCSPRIAAPPSRPTRRSCSFACRTCGYAGRANGAPVGWPGSCGRRCSWIASGPTACRRAARARDGIRSCRCWSRTG